MRRRAQEGTAVQPVVERHPSQWPELRETGHHRAADVLTAEVYGGRMNDVDCARIGHMWTVAKGSAQLDSFADTVLREGGAARTHPSGDSRPPRPGPRGTTCSLSRCASGSGRPGDAHRSPTEVPGRPSGRTPWEPRSSWWGRRVPARRDIWFGPSWSPSVSRPPQGSAPSSPYARTAPCSGPIPPAATTSSSASATPRPSTRPRPVRGLRRPR
ncbi:hypothetical protein ACRAWF_16980 [Streptomyces sp. L7]